MTARTTPTARERDARSRLRQLINSGMGLLRANLIPMKRSCGRPSCRCARSKRQKHLSWYISQSKNGKLRMRCIPQDQMDIARAWALNYQQARKLLRAIGDEYWLQVGRK